MPFVKNEAAEAVLRANDAGTIGPASRAYLACECLAQVSNMPGLGLIVIASGAKQSSAARTMRLRSN